MLLYGLSIYFILIIESYDEYQACFYRTDIFDLNLIFHWQESEGVKIVVNKYVYSTGFHEYLDDTHFDLFSIRMSKECIFNCTQTTIKLC